MIKIKFNDETAKREVGFSRIAENVVKISGIDIVNTSGFTTYIGDKLVGDFSDYDTPYRFTGDELYLSNDGSCYLEPPKNVTMFVSWDDGDDIDGIRPAEVSIVTNKGAFEVANPWERTIAIPMSESLVIESSQDVDGYTWEIDGNYVIYHHEVQTPTWADRIEAQILYTALLTDSLLPEEE